MHPDDLDFLFERTARRIRGEGDRAILTEVRVRHRNGSWRLLQLRGRRMPDVAGRPLVVIVARDITELRAVERVRRSFGPSPRDPPGS